MAVSLKFSDALKGGPIGGILVKLFSRRGVFDMESAEVGAVAVQKIDWRVVQDEGGKPTV